MKGRLFIPAFVLLLLLRSFNLICAQDFNPRLASFLPLAGKTWEGDLLSPDGEKISTVVLTFELFGEGNALKIRRQSSFNGMVGEGFFYWNDVEAEIHSFFIEQSGVFQTGSVAWAGNTFTIEGIMTWPTKKEQGVKQSYGFKNSFELTPEGNLIDRWFMNAFGPWLPGHTIVFRQKID